MWNRCENLWGVWEKYWFMIGQAQLLWPISENVPSINTPSDPGVLELLNVDSAAVSPCRQKQKVCRFMFCFVFNKCQHWYKLDRLQQSTHAKYHAVLSFWGDCAVVQAGTRDTEWKLWTCLSQTVSMQVEIPGAYLSTAVSMPVANDPPTVWIKCVFQSNLICS